MRRFILFLTSASVAVLLGVTVVDAQRPGRAQNPAQARVGVRGGGAGQQLGPAFGRGGGMGQQLGPAFGRGGRGGAVAFRGRGGRGPGAGLGPGLDLTDEQHDAMQGLRQAARDQSAEAADALQTAERALHRAVYADERDDAAVADLAAEVAALQQQLAGIRLQTEVSTADLLTAEQKEAVRTQQAGRRGRGR